MHFRRPCRVRFDLVVNLTAWPIRMRKKTNQPDDNTAFITHVVLLVLYTHCTGVIMYPMLRNLYKRSCGSFVRVSKKWKQYDDLSIYILYAYVCIHRNQFHFRKRRAESVRDDCTQLQQRRIPPAPILHHYKYTECPSNFHVHDNNGNNNSNKQWVFDNNRRNGRVCIPTFRRRRSCNVPVYV